MKKDIATLMLVSILLVFLFGLASDSNVAGAVTSAKDNYAFWYDAWRDDDNADEVGDVDFVVVNTVGEKNEPKILNAIPAFHAKGIKVLRYITLYQHSRYIHTVPVGWEKEDTYQGIKLADHPEYVLRGTGNCFLKTGFCATTCIPLSQMSEADFRNIDSQNLVFLESCGDRWQVDNGNLNYQHGILDYINKKLNEGFDGFFIDNVPQSIARKNSFLNLLSQIRIRTKQDNSNNLIIANAVGESYSPDWIGFESLWPLVDGVVDEGFLRNADGRRLLVWQDWSNVIDRGRKYETLSKQGKKIYVLSFPYPSFPYPCVSQCSHKTDEAFYTYATAKLFNLSYAANLGKNRRSSGMPPVFLRGTFPELLSLKLGFPQNAYFKATQGFYYRFYQNALIVVSPPDQDVINATIPLGKKYQVKDLYNKIDLGVPNILSIGTLSKRSGRVFLLSDATGPTPTPTPLPGDIDANGKVDIFDYNLLVTDFGKTTATPADIDKNGKVDIFDYNILVGNFGEIIQ